MSDSDFYRDYQAGVRDHLMRELPCERIARLVEGQDAPAGYEISRVFSFTDEPVGTGTNTQRVYLVSLRPATR